ncbi:DUF1513 domain-containing protein [Pseudorhodobacter aquimaris]|uniref:DUF1513 domain-containing protein n=1 Tax=Pseudorhodobacter aquimaris TaxID=687412 RepID=UPI00067CC7C8|nr:DUF1513 domain-containing protein [Pseudorhodobacter aquimaris]
MTTRRAFLAGLAMASLPRLTWADVGNPAFLAAAKSASGFVLHGLSQQGQSLFELPLPARGHAACAHPTRALAVAFARRPGTFALVIDCASGAVLHRLDPPEGRHFNGHGVFSADGALLMTSELVAETSAGRIGLWDASDFRRIGEWDSGGIGPHDIKLLADGRLVVANGGIQTTPNGRTELNIETMRPNLTLLSEGTIVDRAELAPEYHQNSIRHLALMPDAIAFAMQWHGDPADPVPLLGLWKPGETPELCPAPEAMGLAMKGYAGSIAATTDRIAVTSAPGGLVMVFDAKGAPLASHFRADLCGIAAMGDDFIATDGLGASWHLGEERLTLLGKQPVAWDNHLIALG